MGKKLQLHIPTPCHENWDKMTPVEKGRFCGSCQKQVVDFTNMSDRQIATFFKKPIPSQSKDGSVCGRFMQDQLDRDIEIPKKRIPWLKYFFQFALPAFLVSSRATAQGKVRVRENITAVEKKSCTLIEEQRMPTITTTSIGDTTMINPNKKIAEALSGIVGMVKEPFSRSLKIKGFVCDSTSGEPIPYATIRILNSIQATSADDVGKFILKGKTNSVNIQIEVSSAGYETKIVDYTTTTYNIIIQLMRETGTLGEVVIVSQMGSVKGKLTMGTYSTIKKQTIIEKVINRSLFSKNTIRLYPNPVKPGSTLNIEWRKNETGNYKLELFNLSGQLIFSKEMWIDEEARLLNIQIPQVAAGNYFLRMTNKTSGKAYTEKIIVQ